MAIEIKQSLKLSQQLIITPQLQQAIKLLQLSRLELQNLIQHELVENPVLEEKPEEEEAGDEETSAVTEPLALKHEAKESANEEVSSESKEMKQPTDFDWENYVGRYNAAEMYGPTEPRGEGPTNDEGPAYENSPTRPDTLQEHLLWQLHMSNFSHEEVELAEELIGGINDEGYLQLDLTELARQNGNDAEKVSAVLKKLQEFDPPGVAARDLQECLKLQINLYPPDEKRWLAHIIDHHLQNLERKNFPAIAKDCNLSLEKVGELAKVISFLEPKPGRPYGGEKPQYITPDVHVHKMGEDYIVILNDDGVPRLQISSFYRNTLMKKGTPDTARDYIQDKLRSALWLIRSIHQRQRTLYKVTCSIVKFQREFLEKGIHYLRPLVLRDVAQDVGMHESTISRVTNNKYAQTPRGLFELKYFFHSSVPTTSGEAITSEAVKNEIKKMISSENPHKPLSDQEIALMLKNTKIQVARRTVAKYRELLGILPSSRRRQIS